MSVGKGKVTVNKLKQQSKSSKWIREWINQLKLDKGKAEQHYKSRSQKRIIKSSHCTQNKPTEFFHCGRLIGVKKKTLLLQFKRNNWNNLKEIKNVENKCIGKDNIKQGRI